MGSPPPLRSLEPFRLERYFAEHEFAAPIHLCASDCESLSVEQLLELEPGAREELLALRLSYTESAGAPALRREIAGLYAELGAGDVLVHAGGEEVIWTLFAAGVGPGDRVAVHLPCYQSLATLPRAFGAEVVPLHTRHEEGWALPPARVAAALAQGASWVVLNLPHNPTGWLMPEADLREIAGLCRDAGARLVVDEVYRGLEHEPEDRRPCAADLDPSSVSIGVTSKSWGLPGLRIGWLATRDEDLLARAAAMKDYTTICAAGPSELLATVALRHTARIHEANRRRCAGNAALLAAFAERHADRFELVPPAAGSVAFPRLRDPAADVERFCGDLRRGHGILLLPGTLIEAGSRAFRVGLGRDGFPAGLAALETALR
jgi:aspartate/methionine/tyrosine aminotransferase